MPIITLTTDLGESDYYAGSIKGFILSQCQDAQIVDITHHIKPFDIFHAAFVLRNIIQDFPAGTVHIVSVSSDRNKNKRFVLLQYQKQFLLGIDNGLFSIAFDALPDVVFNLPVLDRMKLSFAGRDILAYYACRIALGHKPESIGQRMKQITSLSLFNPIIDQHSIKGHIIYIDHYENLMVNINKELFEQERKDRSFDILISRNDSINSISKYYDDVPSGEKLAIFNAAGYLEIAINKGNAAGLLGLKKGDAVIINFKV